MTPQLKAVLKDPLTIAGAVIAVLSAISQGTLVLPDYIPAHVAVGLRQTDAFIVGIWVLVTPILFGMKAYSSPVISSNVPAR